VPVDAPWLEEELIALDRLVRDGETLEAVSRLSTMVRAPVRGLGREDQVDSPTRTSTHT
jgi:hypothetical protein